MRMRPIVTEVAWSVRRFASMFVVSAKTDKRIEMPFWRGLGWTQGTMH